MANVDFPGGFEPVRYQDGSQLVLEYYDISSSNSEIGYYDLVERRNDGFVHPAQASSRQIVGVAAERKAANSGGTIAVHPIVGLVMRAQSDDATIAAQTDLGLNYNITVTTPNSVTGRSQMEIDGNTGAVTATLPINILKVAPSNTSAGNTLGGFVAVECVVNECAYKGGGTGI